MSDLAYCRANEETHRHRWRKHPKTKGERRLYKAGGKACNRCNIWITKEGLKVLANG